MTAGSFGDRGGGGGPPDRRPKLPTGCEAADPLSDEELAARRRASKAKRNKKDRERRRRRDLKIAEAAKSTAGGTSGSIPEVAGELPSPASPPAGPKTPRPAAAVPRVPSEAPSEAAADNPPAGNLSATILAALASGELAPEVLARLAAGALGGATPPAPLPAAKSETPVRGAPRDSPCVGCIRGYLASTSGATLCSDTTARSTKCFDCQRHNHPYVDSYFLVLSTVMLFPC